MDLKEIGLPVKKVEQLNKKKIFSTEDVLDFFPRKYFDYRTPYSARVLKDGDRCSMVLVIKEVHLNESAKLINLKCWDTQSFEKVSVDRKSVV